MYYEIINVNLSILVNLCYTKFGNFVSGKLAFLHMTDKHDIHLSLPFFLAIFARKIVC